jgi:hypothetical protein
MHFLLFCVLMFGAAMLLVPVFLATSAESAQRVLGMTGMDGIHGRWIRVLRRRLEDLSVKSHGKPAEQP